MQLGSELLKCSRAVAGGINFTYLLILFRLGPGKASEAHVYDRISAPGLVASPSKHVAP